MNWCQRDGRGAGKLDAYYDPNERKYYITPESVDLAIAEEKAKAIKHGTSAEGLGKVPQETEATATSANIGSPSDEKKLKKLETEVMDLKIINAGKDQIIEFLKEERGAMLDQLTASAHKVGELENKLLQIESPKRMSADEV